jgi:hypothetical protein
MLQLMHRVHPVHRVHPDLFDRIGRTGLWRCAAGADVDALADLLWMLIGILGG